MATYNLVKGNKFTILTDDGKEYVKIGEVNATMPCLKYPGGTTVVPDPAEAVYEMTGAGTITTDDTKYLQSANPFVFDSLVGSRPANSRRSR